MSAAIDCASRDGFVSLVGAGPGDPDLLTRKAVRRLGEADLVVHDALVDTGVLTLAPTARRVFVGKRAGRPAVTQHFINGLLIREARSGRRVVRLKGGDPFVFGRGGEEALALAAAGIRVEVVPGITSAVAAAALAGIPITHRGVASGFVVVSGHAEEAYRPILDSLTPHCATVVVMMGLGRMAQIGMLLIDAGWQPTTPTVLLLGMSTERAAVRTALLADLACGIPLADVPSPGTIVIGDVVRIGGLLGSAPAPREPDETDGATFAPAWSPRAASAGS